MMVKADAHIAYPTNAIFIRSYLYPTPEDDFLLMQLLRSFAAFALLSISFAACKPDDDTTPIAGKGGRTSLRVIPFHHNRSATIDSCTVYIRYNAQDAPGDGRYDDSAKVLSQGAGVPPAATFPGLQPGNYYLFGRGYDPLINQIVRGGSPFTIPTELVTYDAWLPVGEE